MTGEGAYFPERKRARVTCSFPGCNADLAQASLRNHMRVIHGVPYIAEPAAPPPADPAETYYVDFPRACKSMQCPVPGCTGRSPTWNSLRGHFARRHWQDTIVIRQEGNVPYPRCERCLMFVSQLALNCGHHNTQVCIDGMERVRKRHLSEQARRAGEVTFTVNGRMLEKVDVFKYLGRLLVMNDDDGPALVRNLSRARSQWGRFSPVLTREGASPKVMGYFYQAVVQAVLLFSVESWVLTPPMLRCLEGFHHRAVRRIAKMGPSQRNGGREWVYPPIAEALDVCGLAPMAVYVERRQRTIEDFIGARPILEICRAAQRLPGSDGFQLWWDNRPVPEAHVEE